MRLPFIFLFACAITGNLMAQKRVTFLAEDSLEITADLYEMGDTLPYVLLFHQAGSSRGEFMETAVRISRFGYNCLAVDLRYGDETNYIRNETYRNSVEKRLPVSMLDCKKDILAAIEYSSGKSGKDVVLLGSSFSASLCLIIGKDHPDVSAIIAFSPGEFFQSDFRLREELKNYPKPVFVAGMKREEPYLLEMFADVPGENKTIFIPETDEGQYGARALWTSNDSAFEYWLGLLVFFKSILPGG